MTAWERRIGVIDLYVEDVDGTTAFYQRGGNAARAFGLAGTDRGTARS
jgi:hypothetical protein